MNLAFPALFIFILIAPGIVWRTAYTKASWSESMEPSSLPAMLLWGLSVGSCFHLVWGMASWIIGHPIDLNAAMSLLILKPDDGVARAVSIASACPLRLAMYFLSQLLAAYLFGRSANRLVRGMQWDLACEWLRFDNEWHYLLSGKLVLLKAFWSGREDLGIPAESIPDAVYASVIIESGGVSQLYYGRVDDYHVGKDGRLDRLILADAARRELSNDRPPGQAHRVGGGDGYYSIAGDFLVIPYEQIKNLNIEYVWLEEQVV